MKKFKPTQAEADILKQCASKESVPPISARAVILEPGFRWNTEISNRPCSLNIALVSDDPKWNDTDLSDYGDWREFRAGVELTEEGRGIVDFYIRRRGDPERELCGNVQCIIENGEMVRVDSTGGVRWTKEGGFQ